MKTVILAGGLGTRISEESHLRPKPMIEIGGQPILWHILKIYSAQGFNDFVICCGYKGYAIKEYFADYYLYRSDVTFDFTAENRMTIHSNEAEPWKVTLADTGLNSQTGARIKKIQKYVGDERFMLTYGDGVSDVDLHALIKQHEESGLKATLTGIQPGGRFGVIDIDETGKIINGFREKSQEDGGWINAGFMVLEPDVFSYVTEDEDCVFEREPLENLVKEKQLGVYQHNGFWKCMDTQRDKNVLENLWHENKAPWKIW